MAKPPSTRSCIFLGSTIILAAGVAAFATPSPPSSQLSKSITRRSFASTVIATSAMSPQKVAALSKDEAKTAKIWNRFADNYSKSPISDEESYQKKLAMTRKYFTPSSKVLEFGCGTGGTAMLHAPYVKEYHAIDFSSRMIEIAQQKADASEDLPNLQFECAGIDSWDVPDESYDVVLGLSVLHLLPNKDKALQKVHKLLKPGGTFVSSTTCIGDFSRIVGRVAPFFSWLGVIPTLNVFTREDLQHSLESSGFEIEEEFHPGKDKAVFLIAKKK